MKKLLNMVKRNWGLIGAAVIVIAVLYGALALASITNMAWWVCLIIAVLAGALIVFLAFTMAYNFFSVESRQDLLEDAQKRIREYENQDATRNREINDKLAQLNSWTGANSQKLDEVLKLSKPAQPDNRQPQPRPVRNSGFVVDAPAEQSQAFVPRATSSAVNTPPSGNHRQEPLPTFGRGGQSQDDLPTFGRGVNRRRR